MTEGMAYKAEPDREPYLGFSIEQIAQEDPQQFWCRTVAREDQGDREFGLTEIVHWTSRRYAGWPGEPAELGDLLLRQGLGVVRALIVLDAIPDDHAMVDLPVEGPPYVRPDATKLHLLFVAASRNVYSTYRGFDEERVDVRGIGELLWSSPDDTAFALDRFRTGPWAEAIGMGFADLFGWFKVSEDGFLALDESPPNLPPQVRGFALERTSSMAPLVEDVNSRDEQLGRGVFVVHGRDEAMKQTVARFLEQLNLEAVILHERPNGGRTLIQKFSEESADVGFAVVLASGDDEGRLRGANEDDLAPRPRQNVILELGFLLGSLGRARVAVLMAPGVTMPTDYDGVVWIPFDAAGGWKPLLALELRTAGVPFDSDKLLTR